MTKRILAASDLSEGSDEALRQAHAHSRATGAELAICHVLADLLGVNTLFPQANAESALRLANRDGRPRLRLGSVAERVVRDAHGPVLVARKTSNRGVGLVATDLSDPSMPAIAAGAAEARQRHARLVTRFEHARRANLPRGGSFRRCG